MSRYILGFLGSFFLFASFILGLFILIGQLSNKPFINIISFVHAINSRDNLFYTFGLWNYCQRKPYSVVESCSKAVPGYNWASDSGFNELLPNYTSNNNINNLFIANFILYFVGTGFSFLLWLASLPSLCLKRVRRGQRIRGALMTMWTGITFLIMIAALIIALVLVIGSSKAIGRASEDWQGHAGNSVWFTIGSVVSLFLALLCYTIRSCIKSNPTKDNGSNRMKKSFLIPEHEPANDTPQQSHAQLYPDNIPSVFQQYSNNLPTNNQQYPHNLSSSTRKYSSSLSQQYSPNLNMHYLPPFYNSGQEHV